MTIGIVGLGLIGGSLARAFKENHIENILAYDVDKISLEYASLIQVIDGTLNVDNISQCDYIFLALYPKDVIDFLKINAAGIKKGSIVIDCCGTKTSVCSVGFQLAKENGFNFIGGHPMAGIHKSGFKYGRSNLFKNASMILVPKPEEDIAILDRAKKILKLAGFDKITITTAEKHDEIIAYTSQLAHVVSNAFIKSPSSKHHKGFSAGSYKDLTRVSKVNEDMWTELFIENGKNLSREIDLLIESLKKYSAAIKDEDSEGLKELLIEGNIAKDII